MQIKELLKAKIVALNQLPNVEVLIREKLISDSTLLSEIGTYLLDLGGKRMRPLLALFIARALGTKTPGKPLYALAAGLELIHMATLLHDDIIDKSPLRRHKDSPFKKFGADTTLLCGDFLLTRAFSLCAHLNEYIIDATERACVELTEGEILETPLFAQKHSVASALVIAEKKTASLFKLAAEASAHLAGAQEPLLEACSSYGKNLGIAFQILDDVLDVTSTSEELGKMAGIDILERKPSFVNVFWLASGDPKAQRLLTKPNPSDNSEEISFIKSVIPELRKSAAVTQARNLAKEYAEKARSSLNQIYKTAQIQGLEVEKEAFSTLELFVDYTISRIS